jgi:GDP-L-fucose synthase
MIKRFDFAKDKKLKNIKIWGTGKPLREFCFANDLATNIINCMTLSKKCFYKNIGNEYFYNIGSNSEISIKKLAKQIKDIVGYKGQILFDKSKPDGTFRKYISKKKINKIIKIYNSNFRDSLEKTYLHYLKEKKLEKIFNYKL